MSNENEATGHDLETSEGARAYIADFFANDVRRHDFRAYIATRLAADFACALAQYLAARPPVRVYDCCGEAAGDPHRTDCVAIQWSQGQRPSQAVDLGQFREAVQVWLQNAVWWGRHGREKCDEAKRLLALIDSQAVGNG